MSKNTIISLITPLMAVIVAFSAASAQTDNQAGELLTQVSEVEVKIHDLGVENAGILPTSPFYFLKEWGRNIRKTFILGSVKKAEFELKIVNERAAEIKKMQESEGVSQNIEAINKAVIKYQSNVDNLKERLIKLESASQNPNVDVLIDNLMEKSFKHQEIFDELNKKFEGRADLREGITDAKNKIDELLIAIPAKVENPAVFREKLNKTMGDNYQGVLKELRAAELMEGIIEKLPEDYADEAREVKYELFKKIEEGVNQLKVIDKQKIFETETLKQLPGDSLSRIKVLEEIKSVISDQRISVSIGEFKDEAVEKKLQEGGIHKESVEKLIQETKELLSRARGLMSGALPELQKKAEEAMRMAELRLAESVRVMNEGRFGEAYGQAISANTHARNALRYLTQKTEQIMVNINSFESCAKAGYPILESYPEQCRTPDGRTFTKKLDGTDVKKDMFCIEIYEPVCGADGKTYPNSCYAERAGAKIVSRGECGKIEPPASSITPPTVPGVISPTDLINVRNLAPKSVTVVILPSGFSPSEIKIKKGDKVIWVNKTERNTWPASAVHPTHQIYPAFDALRGFTQSEISYSFIFDKVGSWKYHDHLNPSWTGVIEVSE